MLIFTDCVAIRSYMTGLLLSVYTVFYLYLVFV